MAQQPPIKYQNPATIQTQSVIKPSVTPATSLVDPTGHFQYSNDIKKQVAQKLAQQVVNHIVNEDVIGEKIEEEEDIRKGKGCCATLCGPLTLEYYQPYFDSLTNEIVGQRMMAAFFPFRATFFQIGQDKPDFYGPFWIYCSLVFALAAAGNISSFLNTPAYAHYQYNFNYVPTAASLVFAYGLIIPIVMTIILKLFGSVSSYSQTICIYGYANACVIPVTVACSLPNPQLQWGLIIYAMVNSTLFLVTNYYSELERQIQNRRYIVIWFIAGAQVFILLVFKVYFFDLVYFTQPQGYITPVTPAAAAFQHHRHKHLISNL